MLNKCVTAIFMTTIMIGAPSIHAEIGRIVKQDNAVEPNRIVVEHDRNGHITRVIAKDCSKCPLALDVGYGSEYFKDNKPVSEKKAVSFSGRPGTVIYNAAKALVISVRW
jgi:hypothetical protein